MSGRPRHGGRPVRRRSGGPPFAEVVDCDGGLISARGRLTVQSADLLRGTAEVLRRSGHSRITVDLTDIVVADQDALDLLHDVADELAARRTRLVVLRPPAPDTGPTGTAADAVAAPR